MPNPSVVLTSHILAVERDYVTHVRVTLQIACLELNRVLVAMLTDLRTC